MAYLYPWGNTQQLNLDWILAEVKALKDKISGPSDLTSDDIENSSEISGDNVTAALDALYQDLTTKANRNIFDNPYFGASVVNQRQLQNITGYGKYFIDGWRTAGYTTSYFELTPEGLKITNSNAGGPASIRQIVGVLPEGYYTVSVLVTEAPGNSGVDVRLFANNQAKETSDDMLGAGLHTYTFYSDGTIDEIAIRARPPVASVTILAVKLEKGKTQTLAHFENEQWILNEYPNPEVELLKCQMAIDRPTDIYSNQGSINRSLVRGVVKRNDPVMIDQFISIANTYYANRASMVYGNNTFLDAAQINNQIDCSAFVSLVLRGLPFEDTPLNPSYSGGAQDPVYWVANPKYPWSITPTDYEITSGSTSYKNLVRKGSQIAMMMLENGQNIPIDSKLANLDVGDIIFISQKTNAGDWVESDTFMNISHVAICCNKTRLSDSDPDFETYRYYHEIIDVTSGGDAPVKKRILETSQYINYITYICRPDLGALENFQIEVEGVALVDPLPDGVDRIDGIRVFKQNNIVQVYADIIRNDDSSSSTLNNFKRIATGLPPVAQTITINSKTIATGYMFPRLHPSVSVPLRVLVNANGYMSIVGGTPEEEYIGSFIYICK